MPFTSRFGFPKVTVFTTCLVLIPVFAASTWFYWLVGALAKDPFIIALGALWLTVLIALLIEAALIIRYWLKSRHEKILRIRAITALNHEIALLMVSSDAGDNVRIYTADGLGELSIQTSRDDGYHLDYMSNSTEKQMYLNARDLVLLESDKIIFPLSGIKDLTQVVRNERLVVL